MNPYSLFAAVILAAALAISDASAQTFGNIQRLDGTMLGIQAADTFKDCCGIATTRAIAAAASAGQIPLELVTYPGVSHDFIIERPGTYNAKAAADAWAKTEGKLKQYLSAQP